MLVVANVSKKENSDSELNRKRERGKKEANQFASTVRNVGRSSHWRLIKCVWNKSWKRERNDITPHVLSKYTFYRMIQNKKKKKKKTGYWFLTMDSKWIRKLFCFFTPRDGNVPNFNHRLDATFPCLTLSHHYYWPFDWRQLIKNSEANKNKKKIIVLIKVWE